MIRCLILSAAVLVAVTAPLSAAEISGQYLEARTCEVFTGPCFANADTALGGKHAVMAWKVNKGTLDNVTLDGLSVVAVIAASDTLGLKQTSSGKAVLIVDDRATTAQRAALVRLAQQQAGDLVNNVLAVSSAPIDMAVIQCQGGGCAKLDAGVAKILTRCIDLKHDHGCGNEFAYYPPLARGVKASAAVAEHSFTGKAFNETWKDGERRGAYVGSFEVQ
jgi:hypothetical protein